MASKQRLVLYIYVLILGTVTSLATAQYLQLVYIGRPANTNPNPGANRIGLECQLNSIAVSHPQIFVERSDLGKQPVTIVDGETTVIIEITQDLEGLYSCSHNGVRSINTLRLVAYPQADLSIPSIYAFQAGLSATIQCRLMPGRLSQYYSVRWMKNGEPIATSNPHFVLQGYQLHDTFSLTINNIQLSDSSTSYQCIAFLNDPQTTRNDDIVYDQSRGLGNITVRVYVPPTIVIPPEPRVVAVVGRGQPSTTFICEATRISACATQILWIHKGRNTNQTIDRRFQADTIDASGRIIRSRLNATRLRGRDSGRIDCVAYCMVHISDDRRQMALPLSTSRNTTLSVLTGDYEAVVSVTTSGDVFFRINFDDGYRILEQTRLLMNYTDQKSLKSTIMMSKRAFVNRSSIVMKVARSRVPYSHFQVQVALQVGDEVGPLVSDGKTHEIKDNTNTYIIAGSVAGCVVLIVLLILVLSIMMLCHCYCKGKKQRDLKNEKAKTKLRALEELGKIGGPELRNMEPEEMKQHLKPIEDFISRIAGDFDEPADIPCEATQPAKAKRVVPDGDEKSKEDRETKRQIVDNFLKKVHTQVQTHTDNKLHSAKESN